MLPNKFVKPDNQLSLVIGQVRNDGKISFELSIAMSTDSYINGVNIIDALILDESVPADLFSANTYTIYTGNSLIV
jgi:hypothetical protein